MKKIEIFEDAGEKTLSINYDEYQDSTLNFSPDRKVFESRSSWAEGSCSSRELFEYKLSINPIEVFVRLKERSIRSQLGNAVRVKDGVVLESEIRKERHTAGDPEGKDLIDNLKREVEWNKIQLSACYAEIFYILFLHPEIISREEYRKFLRETEQRIKKGITKIEERLKEKDKTGLQILEGGYGKQLWYLDTEEISKEDKHKNFEYIEKNFNIPLFEEKSPEYCGISRDEFQESPFIIKYIENLLSNNETSVVKKNKKISKTKGIILSVLLTALLSLVLSPIFGINAIAIFFIVQIIAFLQSFIGSFLARRLHLEN